MVRENGMVMMTEEEYNNLVANKDIKVTRKKFLEYYNAALTLEELGGNGGRYDKFDHIYGEDAEVTIHWNGIYCNCSDGATAWNHIISGIEGADSELDDEEEK